MSKIFYNSRFLLLAFAVSSLPVSPANATVTAPTAKDQPRHSVPQRPSQVLKEQARAGAVPRANPVAAELEALSASAEEVFDAAVAGKMDHIGKRVEAVKKNAASLPVIQDESTSLLLPRLTHTLSELDQAAASRDRLQTMRYANRITIIAATVAVPYKPWVPTELSLLDYNARELVIWSEAKRPEKLVNIVIRMHLAWQTLMPKLVDRNATRELKRFSDIMGRLEGAKAPEDFARLSRQASSELVGLKGLFLKPAK